ncbi:MAG: sigma-54-dependent Fis family transcriptional regulator, partial [Clostridia bacterium]|nr:sigma-54-dependent Fis family transcriptional regulator [Clostridia bacterium]
IRHFIVYYTRELGVPPLHMSTAGMEVFMRYSWPGNVRELKNIIERLTVTSAGETIDAARAREVLGMTAAQSAVEPAGETQAQSLMNRKEYELIQNILAEVGGNKTEAAQRLGISRPTLHRKLRQMEALGYDR